MTFSTASRNSFEEFYAEWYPKAVRAARQRGLRDPESVAGDIMLVFFEKDYLDRYDPARDGAATLSSWVNAIIYKRLNNAYRDEGRRPKGVELLDHDRAQPYDALPEFKMLAMSCFELLKDRYGRELAEVWVSVVKQVTEDTVADTGMARHYLVAAHLQITKPEVSSRMAELRNVITHDPDLKEMLSADRWSRAAA